MGWVAKVFLTGGRQHTNATTQQPLQRVAGIMGNGRSWQGRQWEQWNYSHWSLFCRNGVRSLIPFMVCMAKRRLGITVLFEGFFIFGVCWRVVAFLGFFPCCSLLMLKSEVPLPLVETFLKLQLYIPFSVAVWGLLQKPGGKLGPEHLSSPIRDLALETIW